MEEVLEDGGIEVSDYLGRRYVIGYKDLLLTDEKLSYNIEISTLYANNIQLNLFNEDNINSNQYGGNQGLFEQDAHFLLNDSYIKNNLETYFPNERSEDYMCYLSKLNSVGCGYVSVINSIFNEYVGREKEFEDKFGFPMYQSDNHGKIDFNYEYLILDYFNYVNANLDYNIQELYGDLSVANYDVVGDYSTGEASGYSNYSYSTFQKYLKDKYNLDVELNEKYLNSDINQDFVTESNSFDYSGILDAYNELKTDNNSIIVASGDFDLYQYDNYIKHGRLSNKAVEISNGHCMTVTGVTEDGNLIVSSWGEKYVLDVESLKKNNGNIDVHAINFKR